MSICGAGIHPTLRQIGAPVWRIVAVAGLSWHTFRRLNSLNNSRRWIRVCRRRFPSFGFLSPGLTLGIPLRGTDLAFPLTRSDPLSTLQRERTRDSWGVRSRSPDGWPDMVFRATAWDLQAGGRSRRGREQEGGISSRPRTVPSLWVGSRSGPIASRNVDSKIHIRVHVVRLERANAGSLSPP